jgi:outer membrane autotransporter protein
VRFDLGIAYSLVNYQATAGTASASIPGHRTLVTAGLAGTYRMTQAWEFEPSARVYALWENESSYVDSLGTAQRDRNFETGRASAGAKLSYRLQTSNLTTIAPYVGLYADYYFTKDNADTTPEATPAIGGAAARVVSGVSLTARNAAQFTLGGEVGGLGGGKFPTWAIRTRASIPF